MPRPVLTCFAAATMIWLAWRIHPLWAWPALLAYLLTLHKGSARLAFYGGLLWGLAQALSVWGIHRAGLPVYAGLALSYMLAGAAFATLAKVMLRRDVATPALLATLWMCVEWGLASLPYSAPVLLGNSQYLGPALPWARLVGVHGVSWMMVWLCAGAASAYRKRTRKALGWLAASLGLATLLSALAMYAKPQPSTTMIRTHVVQGGISTKAYAEVLGMGENVPPSKDPIAGRYLELSHPEQDPGASNPRLILWPETAVWRDWQNDKAWQEALWALVEKETSALLLGTPRQESPGHWQNTAILMQKNRSGQKQVDIAGKKRLALLAEARFSPAAKNEPLPLVWGEQTIAIGTVFCLETLVPTPSRTLAAQSDVLVALVDGSRFAQSDVARVHAHHGVMRAVESGRALILAGQYGYSQLILPDGEVAASLPGFTAATLDLEVPIFGGRTPFVRWGQWPLVALALGHLVWLLGLILRRVRRAPPFEQAKK